MVLEIISYFFDCSADKCNSTLLESYFHKKVGGYSQQDIQRKREVSTSNDVTVDWLKKCVGRTCFDCGIHLSIDLIKEILHQILPQTGLIIHSVTIVTI